MTATRTERCRQEGCNRWARATGFCIQHGRNPEAVDQDGDELAERRRIFEMRMEAGDYRSLLGSELERVIKSAAQDQGIDDEIGALRYVLAYVLQNETDPMRLTNAVTKIAAASTSAARTRRMINGSTADKLTDAIITILETVDQP